MTTDPSPMRAPASPVASAAALAPVMLGAVVVGAAAAIGLARVRGWAGAAGGMGVDQSAMAGAAGVALGAVIGLSLLWPASSRMPAKFGLMVLASSTVRMLVSLTTAVAALFLASPEVYSFFTALCGAFLLCLAAESIWAVSALRRAQSHIAPPSTNRSLTPGAITR